MQYPDIPNVEFMGDVHLGRRFLEGAPLERRGEREEMVWKQFEHDLNNFEAETHIQVGDLFDNFDVDNSTILRAAKLYIKAANSLRTVQFYVLRGNHDAARSESRVSAFELFKSIVGHTINIAVIDETYITSEGFGLMPWDPFKSALEQAQTLADGIPVSMQKLSFVVCHCDTKAWNGNDFNLIPLDKLKEITSIVVTGHEHIKRSFKSHGVTVHVTGSMQPYSHGEDPDHDMYWTGTSEELASLPDTSHLYIRVVLKQGETAPTVPNCLGYKTIVGTAEEEESDITVDFEEFDTTSIFKTILKELEVKPEFQTQVLSKFTESLNA